MCTVWTAFIFQILNLCIKYFWKQSSSINSTALGKRLSIEGSPSISLFLHLHYFFILLQQGLLSAEKQTVGLSCIWIVGNPALKAMSSPKGQDRLSHLAVLPHVSHSLCSCLHGVSSWLHAASWISSNGLKMASVAILCLVQYSNTHMLVHAHTAITKMIMFQALLVVFSQILK